MMVSQDSRGSYPEGVHLANGDHFDAAVSDGRQEEEVAMLGELDVHACERGVGHLPAADDEACHHRKANIRV
jgi:hypothetical protein